MYYFAYGSNMLRGEMDKYMGDAMYFDLGPAQLHDHTVSLYTLAGVDDGAKANIVPSPGGVVHGILYNVDGYSGTFARMDTKEGVHRGLYSRVGVYIVGGDDQIFEAFTYQMNRSVIVGPGSPTPDYAAKILRGAGLLPLAYQARLRALLK